MTVEFEVLGSIQARVDGRLVELGHAQQRLLLAALLVDVNREVPPDQLAERIWGQEHAQRGTLYGYLSRLRKALADAEGVEIARRPAGYVLTADPAVVDVCRFRELATQARTARDDTQAADLFGQALSLWRGDALSGADTPWVGTVREKLHHEWLAVELDRAEVRLRLGQHTELVVGLRSLAGELPLDERLAGQLMLALYRCGRTAEALGHYQDTHRVLARELGVEPGAELRKLHQQILTSDPALASAPQVGAGARSAQAPAGVPVPRQLPAPPVLFTGRQGELAALSARLAGQDRAGGTVVISAIGGIGGIGKTYLALHWAHQHTERFGDGQLYVNLRGFDPTSEPVPPPVAVRGFLDALGVESAAIPAEPDAQAALYRSLVADKQMLIVLDNARDTGQVVPLLPGSPSCTVVVTSRHQLTSLTATYGAKPMDLDALPEAEARQLLARHLGEDRLAAEPQAVAALLEHCAGLPLALSIMAARAATQPDFPLAYLAEELAETEARLDALDVGDLAANLRAVFACSYHALDAEAAQAFALLGLAPGPDISLHAAASLIAHSTARARMLLRTLEAAHLIRQPTPGRYQLHDLVRLYATERAHHDQGEDARTSALRRLVDFYLHTAHHASHLLDPAWSVEVALEPPATGCTPHRVADKAAARAWFTAEDACLHAAHQLTRAQGWHTPTWQLPATLINVRILQGYCPQDLDMGQAAIEAADQLGDPTAQAMARFGRGKACSQLGRYAEALAHLGQALTLFEYTDNLPGQAIAHHQLAWTWSEQGDTQQVLPLCERALQLYRACGNTRGETVMLYNMGWFQALMGHYEQARSLCEQALPLARTAGNRTGEAITVGNLGYIAHHSGQPQQALDYYQQSLTLLREIGYPWMEALFLEHLGSAHHALGQHAAARQAWQQTMDMFRTQHRTAEAARVQEHLDALEAAPADPPEQ